eukprot:61240-Alexandrium_andersonii.AAC.1
MRWVTRLLPERPPAGARRIDGRGARVALLSATRGSRSLCPESRRAAMMGAASGVRHGAATRHAGPGAALGACR